MRCHAYDRIRIAVAIAKFVQTESGKLPRRWIDADREIGPAWTDARFDRFRTPDRVHSPLRDIWLQCIDAIGGLPPDIGLDRTKFSAATDIRPFIKHHAKQF